MADRTCPGYCCAVPTFTLTRQQTEQMADILADGHQILDMMIPITEAEARRRHERFIGDLAPFKTGGYHARCRHWDESTMLCTAYDARPKICRDHPHRDRCDWCGLAEAGGLPT